MSVEIFNFDGNYNSGNQKLKIIGPPPPGRSRPKTFDLGTKMIVRALRRDPGGRRDQESKSKLASNTAGRRVGFQNGP